ncbi:IS4 family transposase [Marivirga aurantiaca]|uniref:IS4 family transposase n=1 Tax=Marivirga aurantiaca TaxID=2802615 RepID=UPI00293D3653|nr:IS4 family transposase [Marivirga aurantiaca]
MKSTFDGCLSEEAINEIGKTSGFIERVRKLSAFEFTNALTFSVNNQANTSLPDIAADLNKEFEIDVSKEALHKKFTPQAVTFMEELLKLQIANQIDLSIDDKLKQHFNSIKIKDSSKFSLPSIYNGDYPSFNNFSKKNGVMNLQYEYDLVSGKWTSLELTNIKTNDKKSSRETAHLLEKGDLYIRDLGYISASYLNAIKEAEAYFLNRLPPQAGLYNSAGEPLTWKGIDQKFRKTDAQALDMDMEIFNNHRLKCRVVLFRVNDEEYKSRLKQAENSAKSRKVGVSKDHKIRCRYNAFITNVGRDVLSMGDIKKTYQLRWQIELVFKTWKSFFSINKVKKVKKERLECQLLARLLWVLINWHLFQLTNHYVKNSSPGKGVSILKFFKRCNNFSYTLRLVILKKMNLKRWLTEEFLPLIENTECEAKGSKPTSYQILNSFLTH